ncbi:DUF4256 domain-containing protein [Synoicihabitans lomoniglobus]|uniref:DUF4256 domain-containing protein n=1 Tax=Synoicihabitans lomoniglobus TaxID=2909285 RepID=A0AAE9ZT74_9BACT|nr:DUF4256 domain-containing protein [Opitutaceae bacterium LMO-M01]WED63826.1 DUF4256 domain-containing protein [Opitutaceae bacterium LMO-M01]
MKPLSSAHRATLLAALKDRFHRHMSRHEGIVWADVAARLEAQPDKLWSIHQMETTGGEPDVISAADTAGEYRFVDCSPQSPAGRVGYCYDREALDSRKAHKPKNSVMEVATAMGVNLLSETQYRALQRLGEFDTKSSSWIETPADIRKLGGALFGDRRFGHVFVYHNGAQSYYSGRGFRAALVV